jgi:PAS domain S-box-containing protein
MKTSDQNGQDRQNSLFHDVFDLSHDGILILQEGDIINVNKSFCDMLGYESTRLIDTAFENYFDPLELRYHPEKLELIKSDSRSLQTKLKKSDNSIIDVEIFSKGISYENLESILLLVKDISQTLENQSKRAELEDRFLSFFQSMPIAHIFLTTNGDIQDVNQAVSNLLQYTPSELKGLTINDLIPKENPMNRMCVQVIRETLLRKRISNAEIQLVRKDGTLVWVSITTSSIGKESDRHSSIDFIIEDIDRRKKAEKIAKEARERADLYLEVLTHDMTNVTQNSELVFELLRSSLDIPIDLESIIDEAAWDLRRGSRMITNMRALVQLEESHLEKRGLELLQCLERVSIDVTEDFPYKTLNLSFDFPSNVFVVEGHDFLEVVFYNILHNAMTYDQKKQVDVKVVATARDTGQLVKIEFLDNGPGVPDELKEHIFKRTGSPSEQIVGRGLGLTLADRVVRDLNGKIWVEDKVKGKPDLGSRFVILLSSWREEERPWGEEPPIIFYKSDHCVFCGPMFDALTAVLQEFGVSSEAIRLVNVNDPDSKVSESDLIALPTIEIGSTIVTGLVDDNEIRSVVMNMIMTW